MDTKLIGHCVKEDSVEIPSIPPGFESVVPFVIKKAEVNQNGSHPSSSAVESHTIKLGTKFIGNEDLINLKSLRRTPGVKYHQLHSSSDDEYEAEQDVFPRHQLPKGVIRGCEACSNCQKVTAKWHPEEARRPDLEEAPVFYPSEEEFENTLNYISSIRAKAEIYGICRIVPPASWKPPCPLKETNIWESSKFTTRIQRIDKLQNRNSMKKLLRTVTNHSKRRKKKRCMKSDVESGNGNDETIHLDEGGLCETERFGFEPGPEFTLETFQKYADDFMAQYFRKCDNCSDSMISSLNLEDQWQPNVKNVEGEYWRMVETPTEEIEVLYGADLETGVFGSGFPKNQQQVHSDSDIKYINSGWNLNNFARLPGSVLAFESSDISGVLVPWLYIGMCFSSFCWHVEDHHLYSLNYNHWGAPKMWYGVPGSDALKLEAAMRKHLPDLFEEQPDLLHKLVTQLSPSTLRSEGVSVYRCVQNPGEFVLTFPRAYHAGFNCGFNCAEAVNVAPVDWLPHGQNAIELYREQGRKTSISHDKLLLGAAREAVKANWEYNLLRKSTSNNLRWKDVCGKEGVLSKALKNRVEVERVRREFLCKSSQALKMESSFDSNSERECSVCLFDLHLSAAGCHHCSPHKYACLNHAKHLCSCSWGAKFFLFRYEINELNILVEALEGKLSAVYRWARLDLGLALSSYISKDNIQIPVLMGKSLSTSRGLDPKSSDFPSKEKKGLADENSLNSINKYTGSPKSSQKLRPPVVVLALENMKGPSNSSPQKVEAAKHLSPCKKDNSLVVARHNNKASSPHLSQVNSPKLLPSDKPEEKQSSSKDAIFLNDGLKEDLPSKKASFLEKGTSEKYIRSTQKSVSSENCLSNTQILTSTGPGIVKRVNIHDSGEDHAEGERHIGPVNIISSPYKLSLTEDSSKEVPWKKETPNCSEVNMNGDHNVQQTEVAKSCNGHNPKNLELDSDLRLMDIVQTGLCKPSSSQNNLDRYYRQKGPRIAKLVRRINCNVEPLDFGVVRAGKLWSDSRAIYPKGFKSRVRYIDIVDPTNMCYYISEILDLGRDGPLFMVSVEHSSSEVFVHTAAARCWEMVRERVNQEITKQHKLGRANLPPLQPPGSLDGLEMFGFSSPAIVQAIQALDQNHICSDYWKSRPLLHIPQQSQYNPYDIKSEPLNDQESRKTDDPGVEKILSGLFRKANLEELHALYSVLCHKNCSADYRSLLSRILSEAVHKHPR